MRCKIASEEQNGLQSLISQILIINYESLTEKNGKQHFKQNTDTINTQLCYLDLQTHWHHSKDSLIKYAESILISSLLLILMIS